LGNVAQDFTGANSGNANNINADTLGGYWTKGLLDELNAFAHALQTNFQAGVDSVYNAVSAKGSTPASHSLSDILTSIGSIIVAAGNATAADVLSGKTFSNNTSAGVTGTMPNRGTVT
jgi:hypothetical protein